MIELVSSALTFFGLILASDLWLFAASDQVDSDQVGTRKALAVLLALLVVIAQSWWLARRRGAMLRVVLPPALTAGLATVVSLWLVTRRGGRCDNCSLVAMFVVTPVIAAGAAALIAIVAGNIVGSRRRSSPP